MTEQQAKQVIDLLFEIRNALERNGELLEDLISKVGQDKPNVPQMTRKELREAKVKSFVGGGVVPKVEIKESENVDGYVMVTPEMLKPIDYNIIQETFDSIKNKTEY